MLLLLLALFILLAGGLAAGLAAGAPALSRRLGAASAVLGSFLALLPAADVLARGTTLSCQAPWAMPLGSLTLTLDALAAVFLVPIALLSALAALYGAGYLRSRETERRTGLSWLAFNLLVASMIVVCLAGNALLFLLAWETMALSSFFLVAFDYEKPQTRRAAWTYLLAAHLGTAPLLPMFFLFGDAAGTLEFSRFAGVLSPTAAGACFLLAFVGFGAKAGIIPFHVWLPEAHPAAPSHVSALMSGVMIKTGIYALVRIITFLGPPPLWYGLVLLAAGAVSGVLGVLFALAQHDLKKLLAYHSVENIGIILLGLGVGMVGLNLNDPTIAFLGFAGGLLHVVNHALFKGLLFLGAGAVIHATHTGEIDHLGGLLKRMPRTGFAFLIGAAAICGLPPLNGFVSEFLIYLGAFSGVRSLPAAAAVPLGGAIIALALIGGLAAACFAKAFGVIFLGEPRTEDAAKAHEAGGLMTWPMLILAAACLVIGLTGPWAVCLAARAVTVIPATNWGAEFAEAAAALTAVTLGACVFLALTAALAGWRHLLLARRQVRRAVTWDCGYAAPSARMQYTASSFAQPLTDLFRVFLRTRKDTASPKGYFPTGAHLETETPDVGRERMYEPLFHFVRDGLARLSVIQEGRIQAYVLYMVATLLALLLWNLR